MSRPSTSSASRSWTKPAGTRSSPKGTRKEIIAKVNADLERMLALPDVKEKGVTLGYRYIGGPPEKLAAFLNSEIAKWAEVAQSAALK
jgi:tripartite-type tricarboxylate transporter receptor subunit TctC